MPLSQPLGVLGYKPSVLWIFPLKIDTPRYFKVPKPDNQVTPKDPIINKGRGRILYFRILAFLWPVSEHQNKTKQA